MSGSQAENPHTFDCEGCGASLTYAIGTDSLECEYCGTVQEIPRQEGVIHEYDLASALTAVARKPAHTLIVNGTEVRCEGCGARTVLATQSGSCPYCDSPVVAVDEAKAGEVIVPESVLPFKVDREAARRSFHAWVAGLWFAPGDLKSRAGADRIDGCYLPYWTFDAQSTSQYQGQRGEHYTVQETVTDLQGNRHRQHVTKTRWHPASGTVRVPFDDLLVCGNASLPADLIRSLEPWDLQDLRPYEPAFLSGFIAERYAVDLQEAYKLAQQRMNEAIRSAVTRDIGGDEQRIHHLETDLADVKFKLCLLPLWISSFRYDGKVFRFLVNARTGEVAGKRPWSIWKIALAVFAAVMLFFCLFTCMGLAGAIGGGR